jgi:predicted phage terminase large subunit-like protein
MTTHSAPSPNSSDWLINPDLAERILQTRAARKARLSLQSFIEATKPDYLFGWFNELLCEKLDKFLDDVLNERSPRLMIFAPPRHGKSEICSRRFPAYAFGKNPDLQIIATSYSQELQADMNRDIQRIMGQDVYREAFPKTRLYWTGTRAGLVETWRRNTEVFEIVGRRGVYRGYGLDGSITGRGANILIIDDPVKGARAAMSEADQHSTWEWYLGTFRPRKETGAGILLIQTRWHLKDLAGRLLEEMENRTGDVWDVVSFPAIAEVDETYRKAGEALHEARKPLAELLQDKLVMGSYRWNAEFQQRPQAAGGMMFQRRWFETVPAAPAKATRVRAWDLAATKPIDSSDPDWTAGVKMSKDYDGLFYVEHVDRFRESSLKVEQIIMATASRDGSLVKVRLSKDPGQAGVAQVDNLTRKLAGYRVIAEPESGKKDVRAQPFAAQCEAGNVKIVAGAWNSAFFDELEGFPLGGHDDQVDAASNAFNELIKGSYDASLSWVA